MLRIDKRRNGAKWQDQTERRVEVPTRVLSRVPQRWPAYICTRNTLREGANHILLYVTKLSVYPNMQTKPNSPGRSKPHLTVWRKAFGLPKHADETQLTGNIPESVEVQHVNKWIDFLDRFLFKNVKNEVETYIFTYQEDFWLLFYFCSELSPVTGWLLLCQPKTSYFFSKNVVAIKKSTQRLRPKKRAIESRRAKDILPFLSNVICFYFFLWIEFGKHDVVFFQKSCRD